MKSKKIIEDIFVQNKSFVQMVSYLNTDF